MTGRLSPGSRHRLLLGTAMLGTLCLGYGRGAYAACTLSGAGTYACSGDLSATQTLGSGTLTVTTNPGFSISTSAGDAFDLTATTNSLTFTDNNVSAISGAANAITATNNGSGNLSITTTGAVAGTANSGIFAKNFGAGLTINAAAVTGAIDGVSGLNNGSGALSIATTGTVSAPGFGILGFNRGTSLTINAASAYGGTVGIGGYNLGRGLLSITSTGTVGSGTAYGLVGQSFSGMTIQAVNVYGGTDGIHAKQNGSGGALSITTTGTVVGADGSGIWASERYGAGPTIMTSGPVTGSTNGITALFGGADQYGGPLWVTAAGLVKGTSGSGIYARNHSLGSTTFIAVTSTGLVEGKKAGVTAYSFNSPISWPISITNSGTIQNLSGLSTDLAITANGGPTTIVNNGTLTGVVNLQNLDPNSLTNNGTWNTAGGTNLFGGADTLTNTAIGTIFGANSGASSGVTTTFNGLATFNNAGLISMRNGVVGDQVVINANFFGQGGSVALDTKLGGDGSPTDQLVINGNATGATRLLVYNAGGLGAQTTTGIEVVAISGTSTPTAFSLGQPVEAGAYAYALAEVASNGGGEGWYLQSTLTPTPPPTPSPTPTPHPPTTGLPNYRNEVPVYLAMPELANQLGLAMIDNYDARMGGGRQDFVLPGAAAGVVACESLSKADAQKAIQSGKGCATPADRAKRDAQLRADATEAFQKYLMWGRVFGATGEQQPGDNASLSFGTPLLNGKGPQFSASYGGFQAGMDLWRRTGADGSRDDVGLYIGYLNAFANVDQVYSSAKAGTVNLNAYSLGGYWTHFGPQGWYVDSVLQGTWFGQAQGGTPTTGTTVSGSAMTASIEAGDPFRFANNWAIEPQGQLIYQYLQMGSGADAFGLTSFGDTNDLRARIGAKLSYVAPNGANESGLAMTFWGRVNLWRDFLGSAPSATFATLAGLNPTTLDGTLGGTWGQIDVGVDARLTSSVSLYGSAFYDHSIGGGASWSAGGRIGVKAEF